MKGRARNLGSAILPVSAWAEVALKLKLSGRELQIVRCIFDDLTEASIASELGISPHTVHTHMERLHRKLVVSNRVQVEQTTSSNIQPGTLEGRPSERVHR
jgi:DNA-binding CsgD family transcriptional regulator